MAGSNSYYLFPQEGLDSLLNIVPRGTAYPTTNYLGLFATGWSTISGYVANNNGNINVTLNTGTYPVTEVSGVGYGRQGLITASWSTPTGGTATVNNVVISGRQCTTVSGFTFTCSSGTWTVNGIFVASGATNYGTSSGVYFYAPFSDLNAVTVASGDSIVVTPTWQSLPYPN